LDPESGIRDPGSGKNLFRIPDPDPQHCLKLLNFDFYVDLDPAFHSNADPDLDLFIPV
jgi:hypothetical protein